MRNIDELLAEVGIEIPEEKAEEFRKSFHSEYKTIAEFDKISAKAKKAEQDALTATEALKGFENINPEELRGEIEKWQKKAEEAEKTYQAELAERDYNDALDKAMEKIKFTSESAKKAVRNEIKGSGIPYKDGRLLGFEDAIAGIREKDASAFVDEEAEAQKAKAVKFTTQRQAEGTQTVSLASIAAVKDPKERKKLIEENQHLFK